MQVFIWEHDIVHFCERHASSRAAFESPGALSELAGYLCLLLLAFLHREQPFEGNGRGFKDKVFFAYS